MLCHYPAAAIIAGTNSETSSALDCFLHVLRVERFTPSRAAGLWKIDEWAGWRREMLQLAGVFPAGELLERSVIQ